jgi:hypothetical protein
MFPESRGVLFVFSPILGVFFLVSAYFVHLYQPTSVVERVGKALLLEALSSFIVLCGVGFLASIIGPDRMRPLITRVGGKAALAGVLLGVPLVIGFMLLVLYYVLTS